MNRKECLETGERGLFKKHTTQYCIYCDYRTNKCERKHSRCKHYKEFVKKIKKGRNNEI